MHLRNKSIEAISADEDFTASKLNSSTGMSCSNDPVFTRTEYITKTRILNPNQARLQSTFVKLVTPVQLPSISTELLLQDQGPRGVIGEQLSALLRAVLRSVCARPSLSEMDLHRPIDLVPSKTEGAGCD